MPPGMEVVADLVKTSRSPYMLPRRIRSLYVEGCKHGEEPITGSTVVTPIGMGGVADPNNIAPRQHVLPCRTRSFCLKGCGYK